MAKNELQKLTLQQFMGQFYNHKWTQHFFFFRNKLKLRNEISTWPEEQKKVTYPACRWAIWPGPPAWAPGWPRAAQPATGRTGRHRPGRGHGVPSGGYVDSGWESRTSQTKTAGEEKHNKHQEWEKVNEFVHTSQNDLCIVSRVGFINKMVQQGFPYIDQYVVQHHKITSNHHRSE